MAKNGNMIDFDAMFNKPVQPVSEKKEKPVVAATISDTAPAVTEAPVSEEKTENQSKPRKKKEGRATVGGAKLPVSFTIDETVYKDYQYLAKFLDKSVSAAVEDFMRAELKKNAELLETLKKLRNK